MEQIIFDVDGVLFSENHRYRQTWEHAFDKFRIFERDLKRVFEFRRVGFTQEQILKYYRVPKDFWDEIKKYRMEIYETEFMLTYQYLLPNVKKVLKHLHDKGLILNIATLRRNEEALLKQLKIFGIHGYFSEIMTMEDADNKDLMIKRLIGMHDIYDKNIFITDTIMDVISLQFLMNLDYKPLVVYTVSTGLDSQERLASVSEVFSKLDNICLCV